MKSLNDPPSDCELHPDPPGDPGGGFSPTLPAGLFDAASITDELHRVCLTYSTTAEFAADVGLSVAHLSQIMNGRAPVTGSVAAFFGMRRAYVYEVAELKCPYVEHARRGFVRMSAAYMAARDVVKARLDEDQGILPADVYDARREAAHMRMAHSRAMVTAHKPVTRKGRYAIRTPVEVRAPGETRQKTMSLERVRLLVERGDELTGRQLRMAYARLKQVLAPKSRTLPDSRELALALMDRLKLKPPPAEDNRPVRAKAPQSPALKVGQVRRQKQALMALVMTGLPVKVTDDQPVRLAAALALVEDGLVQKLSDEVSRVQAGRMVAGENTRRMRRTLAIARMGEDRI